eukprot:Lankesteria_metandrocarpae@DN1374_c0_g1_i1.p1
MSDDVVERTFTGKEGDFSKLIKSHFQGTAGLTGKQVEDVAKLWKIPDEYRDTALNYSSSYEIVPVTLPTKSTDFMGVNAYIDSVGRVKGFGTNSRATRVCGTDVRGDCFVSKTFDDEDKFRRLDFTKSDLEAFLKNPPASIEKTAANVKSSQALFEKLQSQTAGNDSNDDSTAAMTANTKVEELPECASCGAQPKSLLRCKCQQVFYCNRECQRSDWRFHQRTCSAKPANAC